MWKCNGFEISTQKFMQYVNFKEFFFCHYEMSFLRDHPYITTAKKWVWS